VPRSSPPSPGNADFFEVSAGERTVGGIWHENYWFRRHEVVYQHLVGPVGAEAARLGRAPDVLDAGCGEGFGADLLNRHGARVVALDYDAWTAQHLATAYPTLPALRANLVALPLTAASTDVVVSLQTVEHLWDQERFVAECARVLRPGGLLVLSTPNRRTFPPGNVFHNRELDAGELADLLAPVLDDVRVAGVHHGARLAAWESVNGDLVDAQVSGQHDEWSTPVRDMVAAVAAADFEIRPDTAGSLDLVATAVAR
jgi:SAM-dependent methyltransferase